MKESIYIIFKTLFPSLCLIFGFMLGRISNKKK